MYDAVADGDFDYLELWNQSPTRTLDLGGVTFTDGLAFTIPEGTFLEPDHYLLVVRADPDQDFAAFRAHYGLSAEAPIVGPYEGNFRRSGERVELRTAADGETITAFTYSPERGWPLAAAGAGHSLVPLDRSYRSQDRSLDYGGNWRPSTHLGGSPGRPDPPPPAGLLIHEFMANTEHSDPLEPARRSNDWIELFNPTALPVDLNHHYLSDRYDDLRRWPVPPGLLDPGSYLAWDEVTGFNQPLGSGFSLNPAGGELYLSYLPGTSQDRVIDAVTYLGQQPGVSLGRHPGGGPYWHRLTPTLNAPNSVPLGSVIFSEFMYNPPRAPGQEDNTLDEFIELFNPTDTAIDLFNAEGGWQVADGIRFEFEPGTHIPGGEYLLLVNFDPADAELLGAFRALYRVRPDLPVLGPYAGNLSNSGERVSLIKPQPTDHPADPVSWVLIDEVIYFDRAPWPREPDGEGASLHRIWWDGSGNDPANWLAVAPAPGGTRFGEGNLPVAPETLSAVPGLQRIALEWTRSPTATAYRVYRAATGGGPYGLIAEGLTQLTHLDTTVVSGTTYYYVVSALNAVGESSFSPEVTAAPASGEGVILREWWLGIPGNAVSDLTSYPDYPDQPSGSELIGRFEGPTNWADNYGTRVRGLLHPPVSGEYTFWIAGDDYCELWLGSDATPANASLIARVPGWTNSREWTRYSDQQSAPVILAGGQGYYIEAIHKEGGGGDNLAVAWRGPGFNRQVIAGAYLSAWIETLPTTPTGLAALAGAGQVALNWLPLASATAYHVYRSTVAGGPYTTIATGLALPGYTDPDVINDLTYYYVVSAIVGGEEGPLSIEVNATPRAQVPVADYPAAVLAAGPIAYWRLNEVPGQNPAYDELETYPGTYGFEAVRGLDGPRPPVWHGFDAANTSAGFVPGLAESHVTIPPLDFGTDTLTITAWINPDSRVAYGGIVFYRSGDGSATGLNLRPEGDLGYHWNDAPSTYSWTSGLTPPLGQWSFVALAVDPSQATMHLVNAAGHQLASKLEPHGTRLFSGPLRIGGDPYGSERVFAGRIDEVALFNRALSADELQELYTLAVHGGPPELRISFQHDGTVILEWASPGTLRFTDRLGGAGTTWTDHPTSEPKVIVTPTEAARFYRLER